jgi:endonuclease/exonuclease/phosphatase family metal-dependent hydrolase
VPLTRRYRECLLNAPTFARNEHVCESAKWGEVNGMRVATWNLERGFHGRECVIDQQHVLAEHDADILVLTEVPTSMSTSAEGITCSPALREGGKSGMDAWVSITAKGCRPIGLDLPFERMAAAAETVVDGEPCLVYGSVLPWLNAIHQAPYLRRQGESPLDLFKRVLREQVNDMAEMCRRMLHHTLIWAGDFNQTLSGPNYGGSNEGRKLLAEALAELNLVAWNHESAHAKPPMHAIDLICGPSGRRLRRIEHFEPELDGKILSDHAGYVVEI